MSWSQNEVAFALSKKKIGIYFSVVIEIRENAPEKANDSRLVSREPQERFVLKGYFERYHVAVLQALISLDQLRRQLYCVRVRVHSLCRFFEWVNCFLSKPRGRLQ